MAVDRNLLIKAFTGDDEAEHQLAIYYYMENSDREAIFWLNKSIKKGNLKALELLQEINTAHYLLKISARIKKRKKQCQNKTMNLFI